MHPLSIANTTIRTDAEGRYCLNDLHKASGEEQKHQPRYWLSNQQTRDLIAEFLSDSGIPLSVIKGGLQQGTYVVKELVYAYAMWISPAFHLKVIRAYDAMANTSAQTFVPRSFSEALRLAADLEYKKEQAEALLALAAPKAEALDRIANTDGLLNLQSAAKVLQQQPNKFCNWLREMRWIFRRPGSNSNVAYQDKIQAGYLTHKTTTVLRSDGTEKVCDQVLITPKGLTKLSKSIVS
ncbi:phage antirepressor KilAC domain-containing protein [Chitinimonas sp. PSY-7]|uniref:phage antirepressor KilAC domain-containing protein n=1 Tax=Chitinimonas sp. PSY-7 TaxID=3459088 RepID=UPI0040402A56